MIASRTRLTRAALLWTLAALAVASLAPSMAGAQTPDEACAAGELYLYTPSELDLRLQLEPRKGLLISWPDLSQVDATCYSLDGTDNLDVEVTASGGFGDRVDRVLRFVATSSGTVGGREASNLVVGWNNDGPATYGSLGGALNLSNNGGLWRFDASEGAAGAWEQINDGLPMTWRQTNVRALARGTGGVMLASFTRGATLDTDPQGLWRFDGESWSRVAADLFTSTLLISHVEIAPGNNDVFAVGTRTSGVFVTTDGGATFQQWSSNLPADPQGLVTMPSSFRTGAMKWLDGNRLLVAISSWGFFISEDAGASFARHDLRVPATLDVDPSVPESQRTYNLAEFNRLSVDPNDSDRVLASLLYHGVYESVDGGETWTDLYGDLLVRNPAVPGAWIHTATDAVVDRTNGQVIVMAVRQKGLYRTADGGATWTLVGQEPGLQPSPGTLLNMDLLQPAAEATIYALEDGHALLASDDGGVSWYAFPEQLALKTAAILAEGDAAGDVLVATWAGGTYVPGSPLPLSQTYNSATSTNLRSLDLGLTLSFSAGTMAEFDEFRLVAQTFQGWAVWRAPSHDPDNMTLIGLYDRVNPEDCIEGYCGDFTYEPIPACFAAKRAACFELPNLLDAVPDTVRFFDDEVYNGFAYNYAVTSFDYGNTAMTTPENNTNEMLFSPRWQDDPLSPFTGDGNREYILINEGAAKPVHDDEIYAYPNPVRLGAGIPGSLGEMVVFTNLPEGSSLRIFTTAGDDVIDFGPESLQGGQIYWRTENRSQEQVSAGVYLYKVESPQREPYWGRIVVIR